MEIVKVDINELISPEYNPRQITDDEMEKLKNSINEFGYIAPIIVNKHNNHIVGGNQRYEALKELGYKEIDVVYIHEKDENREKALNIALNKISGEWDEVKLNQIFTEMKLAGFDKVSLTGFEDYEVQELSIINDINYDDDFDLTDDDLSEDKEEEIEKDEVTCPYCNETFEI